MSNYKTVEKKAKSYQNKIERYAKKCSSISEVSKKVGLNNITLKKYADILGVDLPKGGGGRQKMLMSEEKAKYLFEQNVPFKEMGEQLGVKASAARNYCLLMGWKRPGPSICRLRTRLSPRTQKIIDLRLKGVTLQEIGDTFGVTRERIRQIIRDYGDSQILDRQFAETCLQLLARGYKWNQIQDMIGSANPVEQFLFNIQHLFSEEEKAKYFV